MIGLLEAMFSIALTWAALVAVFCGLGRLARRVLRSSRRDVLDAFWIGWAAALALLQVWSLVRPVDGAALALIAVLGLAGWSGGRRELRPALPAGSRVVCGVALLAAAVWLANRAVTPPLNNDSGGYHLPAVRWAAEQPVVPGLGNLYFRLAFNSAYFLYAALLDVGPWTHRSHHLASGLLLLMLLAGSARGLVRVVREGGRAPLASLFEALLLPILVKQGLGPDVASPSPDAGVFALGIVLCRRVVAMLDDLGERGTDRESDLREILLLSVTMVAVKASGAGLAMAAAMVACVGASRVMTWRSIAGWGAGLAASVLLPWAIRDVILSGHVAYPAIARGMPVEWGLPSAAVSEQALWIRSWARMPGAHWSTVIGWGWLGPWARRLMAHRLEVLVPVALTVLAGAVVWRARSARRADAPGLRLAPWVALLPPVTGLVFWFVTAPDLRFAGAGFWLLASAALTVAARAVEPARWAARFAIAAAGLASIVVFAHAAKGDLFVPPLGDHGFHPTPVPDLHDVTTDSGLVLHVPGPGGECWYGPLPCTPLPDRRLRLRREGDLRHGFVVAR